ncbi:MAG: hypothetical protein OHK0039_19280 [Bacteroidia bacterium]
MRQKDKHAPEQLWVEGPQDLFAIATLWEAFHGDPKQFFFIHKSEGFPRLKLDQTALPRAGLWMMSDNQQPGMPEDSLRNLIAPDDDLIDEVTHCLSDLVHKNKQRFPDVRRSKAFIYTWLAWQAEPGNAFGTAIRSRHLHADYPQGLALVSWLARLFQPDLPAALPLHSPPPRP